MRDLGRDAQQELDRLLHIPDTRHPTRPYKKGDPYINAKDSIKPHGYGQSLDVVQWCNEHKILLKKGDIWWWLVRPESSAKIPKVDKTLTGSKLERAIKARELALRRIPEARIRTGYIQGLEAETRGYPRITNGIDVWIERHDGTLFKGHRQWLVWDKRARDLSKLGQPLLPKPSKMAKPSGIFYDSAVRMIANGKVEAFTAKLAAHYGSFPVLTGPLEIAAALERYMNDTSVLNTA